MRTTTHSNDFLESRRRQGLANQVQRTLYFCRDGHLISRNGVFIRTQCNGHLNPGSVSHR